MLNAFCSTQALKEIALKYGSVFDGISPDYGFCFRALDHFPDFLILDHRLLVGMGDGISNGQALMYNRPNEHSRDFMKRSVFNERWASSAPVLDLRVPGAAVLGEYEYARSRQQSGNFLPFNADAFYSQAVKGIRRRIAQGFEFESPANAIQEFARMRGIEIVPIKQSAAYAWVRSARAKVQGWVKNAFRLPGDLLMRSLAKLASLGSRRFHADPCSYRGFHSLIEALRFDAAYPPVWQKTTSQISSASFVDYEPKSTVDRSPSLSLRADSSKF